MYTCVEFSCVSGRTAAEVYNVYNKVYNKGYVNINKCTVILMLFDVVRCASLQDTAPTHMRMCCQLPLANSLNVID